MEAAFELWVKERDQQRADVEAVNRRWMLHCDEVFHQWQLHNGVHFA